MIERFLLEISHLDSNNGKNKVQIGEREGRCYSSLVQKRNYYLIHGIGRSGDVTAMQPKAAGSSLINKLLAELMKNFISTEVNLRFVKEVLVLPFATGMALTLSMLTLKKQREQAKYVIWCRIDQKTCLKAIRTANLEPLVVEPVMEGEEIVTNLEQLEELLSKYS